MKAMAKNPDDRYGSAEELRADLLRFADGRPVEAGDPGVTTVLAAVGATQAVPTTTGRTMALPAGAGPPPTGEEDLDRKKRTRNLIILLVLLLVALGVIAFFLFRSLGDNVSVPDVVGLSSAQATQTLHEDHLTVGSSTVRTSTTAKGIVLSTDPKAGSSVAKNSAVNLVVSGGPNIPVVEVPSVTGKQLTQAIQLLQAANLGYTVHNVTSDQAVGTVLSQDPAAGTRILATRKVVLTVSSMQTSVSVPSVVGQSPASAGGILTQAGLKVGSQSTACSGQPNGLVVRAEPGRRQHRAAGHAVNLVVSSGNCISVPGVVGQSQGAASSAITGAGLVANATFDTGCPNGAQPGTVDSQSPAAERAGEPRDHGEHLGVPVGDDDHRAAHHDAAAHHDVDDRERRRPRAPSRAGPLPAGRSGSPQPAVAAPSWPRKLASRAGPEAVRTDSGWNCTPSTGRERWRRPMTTPSVEVAVTSSSSGTDSGRTTSEW